MQNMDNVPLKPKTKAGKKVYDMVINDDGTDDSGVFAISLVEDPAIESDWIYMSKAKKINLAEVSADKRLLLGPVLIPNKEIPRVDDETGEEYFITFSPETIEKAAHLYLANQHNNDATLEHETPIDGVSTVESWVIKDPKKDKSADYGMNFPAGTWMAMMKVNNDEIWHDFVKTGKVKGFSVEALLGHELVKASKVVKQELGYEHNTGYRQAGPRETTRGYGQAPAHSSSPTPYNSNQPFALEPGFGGPTPGSLYDGLSNYDGIGSQVAMEKMKDLITKEYNGDNHEEILEKIKDLLTQKLTWAEFDTAVSIGSSYSGQFGSGKAPIKSGTYEVDPNQKITNYFYKNK